MSVPPGIEPASAGSNATAVPIGEVLKAAGISLNTTLGASEIGVNLASIAFGITLLQMYIYFQRYSKDQPFQKLSVIVLSILDGLQLVFTMHFVYYYTVTEWGNLEALAVEYWSFKLQFIFTIIILLAVQSLYVLRMWKLSGENRIIPAILTVTTLVGYGIGTVLAVKIYTVFTFQEITSITWIIYLGFSSAAANDVLIALAFFAHLRSRRKVISETRSIVTKLMIYIVSTGMFTSAVSIAEIILFSVMPNNLVFISLEFMISKIYVNSFLAMLNARQYLREQQDTYNLNPLNNSNSNNNSHGLSGGPGSGKAGFNNMDEHLPMKAMVSSQMRVMDIHGDWESPPSWNVQHVAYAEAV